MYRVFFMKFLSQLKLTLLHIYLFELTLVFEMQIFSKIIEVCLYFEYILRCKLPNLFKKLLKKNFFFSNF